jgi:hypothetical protein
MLSSLRFCETRCWHTWCMLKSCRMAWCFSDLGNFSSYQWPSQLTSGVHPVFKLWHPDVMSTENNKICQTKHCCLSCFFCVDQMYTLELISTHAFPTYTHILRCKDLYKYCIIQHLFTNFFPLLLKIHESQSILWDVANNKGFCKHVAKTGMFLSKQNHVTLQRNKY